MDANDCCYFDEEILQVMDAKKMTYVCESRSKGYKREQSSPEWSSR